MSLSVTLGFHAQFTASKVGKTGLTVTIDIKKVTKADGTITSVVSGGSATENWRGVYFYRLANADPETFDYEAVFITSDTTVDQKEIAALWTQFSAAVVTAAGHVSNVDTLTTYTGNTPQTGDNFARLGANGAGLTALGDARLANLDAAVSTRLATVSYAAPDNTGIASAAASSAAASTTATAIAAILTGITRLANWLRALARSSTPDATALAEINASGGTFSATTHSLQAIGTNAAGGVTVDNLLNATVGSRPAGSLGAFVSRIGQVTMTTVGPVLGTGDVMIVRGNDYAAADTFAIDLPAPASKFGNLTGATSIILAAKNTATDVIVFGPIAGTIINANTESQALRFEPTAVDTVVPRANEGGPDYLFEARCQRPTSARHLTTNRGALLVLDNVPTS